ncbi:tRNA (guanine-N1)-methyltransferase [Seonamhaeicola sp. S2-3]|uniref:tRNA (guanine-N1)-methyltransferase n=1 Tax=Seonamhaeicola sp. S2-3 TaxID=1936081 RepID=UPI0009727D9C|nr:tRNA (guanine-N1)-methyltransferase [Seonamhaeicola sp. S2-3]APY09753.1 tRNA (guanine-N1)-methyltransferase [Seonamhaeicola sp. S2-3]
MNSIKQSTFIFLFLLVSLTSLNAQETQQTQSINDGSINDKFEFVLRKSGNFKGTNGLPYEAVKRSMLLSLQKQTNDSINTLKSKLSKSNTTIINQNKEINDLKSNLSKTQATLDNINKEKDSMALFGMQMSKTGYNMLMWTIIAALLALLIFFIYKFKNSNAITKQAKQNLAEIEEEFDEHRRVALEREQKVRRQLQDEINKQKGA